MDCKCVGAFVAVLLSCSCTAFASAGGEAPPLPDEVLPFVEQGRTVIAYQESAADKPGERNIVFGTRLLIPSEPAGAATHADEYICEIVALREAGGALRVTGRTAEAVDCGANERNRDAAYRELDKNLTLSGDEFTFINHSGSARWGWVSYSFRYDAGRWLVSEAKGSWASREEGFHSEVDESIGPDVIGHLYMEDFSVDPIQVALRQSRKTHVNYEGLVDTGDVETLSIAGIRSSFHDCIGRADRDVFAVNKCSEVEHRLQDVRLNDIYIRLMRSADGERKVALRSEQRRWIRARDLFCNSTRSERVGTRYTVATCHMYQTLRRADALHAMLEES